MRQMRQTSKKCESIVIQMVINNLSRIKCGKKTEKNLNIIVAKDGEK